jgi:hypothetical protein
MTEPTGESKTVYELTGENMSRLVAKIRNAIREEIDEASGLATEKPMTLSQAAEFMNISLGHLHRILREDSKFPSHKLGGMRYFYASEINGYIKAKKK